MLSSGTYRRIAIVSADQPSRGLDWTDPEASLIFGDGAAAAIVEKGNGEQGVRSFLFRTYSEGRQYCEIRAGGTKCNPSVGSVAKDYFFRMNGKQVLKLALQKMPGFLRELLHEKDGALDSVDVVIQPGEPFGHDPHDQAHRSGRGA